MASFSSASSPLPVQPLLNVVARCLAPFFHTPTDTVEIARRRAAETIATYAPQTPQECLLIGQFLALSLAAMHAMAQAIQPGLTVSQQLHFLTRATSLGRSATQADATLGRSRQTQPGPHGEPAQPPTEHQATPYPSAGSSKQPDEPSPTDPSGSVSDSDDALEALIEQVMAERPPITPRAERPSVTPMHARQPGSRPVRTALHSVPLPPDDIRHSDFDPAIASRPLGVRDALMCSSAMTFQPGAAACLSEPHKGRDAQRP